MEKKLKAPYLSNQTTNNSIIGLLRDFKRNLLPLMTYG